MNKEKIILVDIDDNEIGYTTKEDAHKKGQLHRAFSVYLHNKDSILIQRRSMSKYHSAGLWANACCSHPREGESLSEATVRRLKEELGVACDLEELFSFIYKTNFSKELFEYELDHVFLGEYSGPIELNVDEASEYRWISIDELSKSLVIEPEKYASWFIISAPRVIEHIRRKIYE